MKPLLKTNQLIYFQHLVLVVSESILCLVISVMKIWANFGELFSADDHLFFLTFCT